MNSRISKWKMHRHPDPTQWEPAADYDDKDELALDLNLQPNGYGDGFEIPVST